MRYAEVQKSKKGQTYVDLRKYNVDKMRGIDIKPGKEGICLNVSEYQKLKTVFSEIDAILKTK